MSSITTHQKPQKKMNENEMSFVSSKRCIYDYVFSMIQIIVATIFNVPIKINKSTNKIFLSLEFQLQVNSDVSLNHIMNVLRNLFYNEFERL